MSNSRVLGQLLLAGRHITEAQLTTALREQRSSRERLGEILIKQGVPARAIALTLAQQLRLAFADPPLQPEPAALQLIDRATATRLRVLPLSVRERMLRVAMVDPLDMTAVDDLQFRTGKRVEPVVAEAAAIESALAAYEPNALAGLLQRIPARAQATESDEDLRQVSEAPPVVAVVDHILTTAVQARASDIHIEPAPDAVLVRGRIDGVLRELLTLPKHTNAAVVSRIKVMGALDISIKRKPQDGRTSVRVAGRDISARISTLPANGGEKVVLRLLDGAAHFASLADLGMSADALTQLRRMLHHPHGVLLVTGPTGSGKSTTLYAALTELDRQTRNIITLEDPVEYKIAGITQVQVDRRAGLSFPRVLRAVLRQDPDVIMIGEMRDRETVEVALAAAMTGHLVLSTLHTNDAPSAVTRLFDMGAQPYLVAACLIGVVAQRLVRRTCSGCGGTGCGSCGGSGFRGRAGIYEMMAITPEIAGLVARKAGAHVLRKAGRANGMTSLAEDARAKVEAGLTTESEASPLLALSD
ncbi:MAG TPA: ATPase, T2SS/T4P/T4SS family [Longimicrobiales bacterium]